MFSPTAIADFLACRHLTTLNRAAAAGEIKKPVFADPLELLIRLGLAHEEAYLRELSDAGLRIATIPTELSVDSAAQAAKAKSISTTDVAKSSAEAKRTSWTEAAARTVEAMRAGADVIYQGPSWISD